MATSRRSPRCASSCARWTDGYAAGGEWWQQRAAVDEESTVPQGTVRWFDAERGFGFLYLGDDAEDLFVHASEIITADDGPRLLREGQVVEFELGEGDRGPQARRVRVTGDVAPDALLGVLGT